MLPIKNLTHMSLRCNLHLAVFILFYAASPQPAISPNRRKLRKATDRMGGKLLAYAQKLKRDGGGGGGPAKTSSGSNSSSDVNVASTVAVGSVRTNSPSSASAGSNPGEQGAGAGELLLSLLHEGGGDFYPGGGIGVIDGRPRSLVDEAASAEDEGGTVTSLQQQHPGFWDEVRSKEPRE